MDDFLILADECKLSGMAFGVLPRDDQIDLIYGTVCDKYIYSSGRYSITFNPGFQTLAIFKYACTLPSVNIHPAIYTTRATIALRYFKTCIQENSEYVLQKIQNAIESSKRQIEEYTKKFNTFKEYFKEVEDTNIDTILDKIAKNKKDIEQEKFLEL